MRAKKLAHTNKCTPQHEDMRLHQRDTTILMKIDLSSQKTRKCSNDERHCKVRYHFHTLFIKGFMLNGGEQRSVQ